MSLFDVNKHFLQQRLPGLELDYALLADTLNLDPAHLQLVNDCYLAWRQFKLPSQFWLYVLLLVDEINRGSSCLKMTTSRFQAQQKQFNLMNWQDLNVNLNNLKLANLPVLVCQDSCLFFEKYHRAEQLLQQQITSMIHGYQGQYFSESEIQSALENVFNNLEYPLNREQTQAVITGLIQPFSLVSGGPGTGKTTIMTTLLRCLQFLDVPAEAMALAAPTGRAAYRMTESLQSGIKNNKSENEPSALASLEARTIHRLIGKNHRFNQPNRYHSNHKLPYQVIVIDEVSMVDLQLMTEFLAAVSTDCRLILVGDQFQLPSVESGAVLADLMPPQSHTMILSESFATQLSQLMSPYVDNRHYLNTVTGGKQGLLVNTCTILKQSHRSIEAIQNISESVRMGDSEGFFNHPELIELPPGKAIQSKQIGVLWKRQYNNIATGLAFIWDWFKQQIELEHYYSALQSCLNFTIQDIEIQLDNLDRIFNHINQQQILTLQNRGIAGQEMINRFLCQQIKHQWKVETGQRHFHGQVVMMRRNDYDKQLFNGDVGVLLQSDHGWQVVFPGQGGYRVFALPLLPELTTAFAITIHKSQGSEYRHVLMPLPDDINNRLLGREIIYTGMTRAKSSVLIYGNQMVLKKAIERHSDRQSGLQFW